MSLVLVTPPVADLLTESEVWEHLRLPLIGSPAQPVDRALIASYIATAVAMVDGSDGVLQRALITQTWNYKLDCFPVRWRRTGAQCWRRDPIRLPLPPLQSVDGITYIDLAGNTQTLSSSRYTVAGIGDRMRAEIVPAYGFEWPDTREDTPEAVTIQFTAGYGDAATDVPEPIRHALLLLVSEFYCDREGEMGMPAGAKALLDPYMVVSL